MLASKTDLLAQIVAGEDSSLELKDVVFHGAKVRDPSRDQLADELAAFANAGGGVVVLGVDDTSKEILGIPIDKLDSLEQFVTEVCHDSIDPALDVTTQKLSIPDSLDVPRWVLRVHVARSLSIHRSPGGYMRRVGSSKRKMAQDQLGQLFQLLGGIRKQRAHTGPDHRLLGVQEQSDCILDVVGRWGLKHSAGRLIPRHVLRHFQTTDVRGHLDDNRAGRSVAERMKSPAHDIIHLMRLNNDFATFGDALVRADRRELG